MTMFTSSSIVIRVICSNVIASEHEKIGGSAVLSHTHAYMYAYINITHIYDNVHLELYCYTRDLFEWYSIRT